MSVRRDPPPGSPRGVHYEMLEAVAYPARHDGVTVEVRAAESRPAKGAGDDRHPWVRVIKARA
jgi:hypothetical protein